MSKSKFNSFPDLTLLITHYNRSSSLRNLLTIFQERGLLFADVLVSDDGSNEQHLSTILQLRKEFNFTLVTSPQNRGLGNNLNKGQAAVITPFTLYVQEDFEPTKFFVDQLSKGYAIMKEQDNIDIIRFYAYFKYPYLKSFAEGFSEMYYPRLGLKYKKIYAYSDHPHLRRSNFLEKFGKYAEGIKGDRTEYRMCLSFIQRKGKGLFFDDYQKLFVQKNSSEEPSTMKRYKLSQSNNSFIKIVRDVYRQIRYNFDIYFNIQ